MSFVSFLETKANQLYLSAVTVVMDKLTLLIIVNPASGKDEPILELIGSVFHDSSFVVNIHVLEREEKCGDIVTKALSMVNIIAVYGGDGTVTEVASSLIGTNMPLAIIPGGTANVLSKELKIPQETELALKLIRDRKFTVRKIDTGTVNDKTFLLRLNFGLMSDMITKVNSDLKKQVGQLAYGVSAFKSWTEAEQIQYDLEIDGKKIQALGVALTVTNSGAMGIGDIQLAPKIKVDDGLLDVLLLKDAGALAIASALGNSFLGVESESINHWSCRTVKIILSSKQTYICDDSEDEAHELTITVVPSSLAVIVPDITNN